MEIDLASILTENNTLNFEINPTVKFQEKLINTRRETRENAP